MKTIMCSIALFFATQFANAADFEAYAEVPGPTVSAPSYRLQVSTKKCPTKGAPKGWKLGAYQYNNHQEPACWVAEGPNIKMCPQGQYETQYKATDYGTSINPCHIWPINKFYYF